MAEIYVLVCPECDYVFEREFHDSCVICDGETEIITIEEEAENDAN